MAWRGLNAGSCSPLPLLVYPQSRLLKPSSACRRFYQAGRLDDREGRQVPRAPLPNLGVTFIGEMCATSWEGITPPSSLVLAHSPLPLGSLLLRLSASFRESLQVVTSPCCPRQLPDVIPDSVGIEIERAPLEVRGFRSCSFDCRTGSQSHHGVRFSTPP